MVGSFLREVNDQKETKEHKIVATSVSHGACQNDFMLPSSEDAEKSSIDDHAEVPECLAHLERDGANRAGMREG